MKMKKYLNIEGSEKAIFIAKIADALSHPLRVSLVHYVNDKCKVRNDTCNKDLVEYFPYSQSSLSQHVKKLVQSKIFSVEYVDKFSYYTVNINTLEKYVKAVQKI